MARREGFGWGCAAWRGAIRYIPAASTPSGDESDGIFEWQNQ